MADNKTFQSATPATLPANTVAATKEVSFSGNTADVQLIEVVAVTGSEGSRTLNEISDASGLKIQDGGNTITVDGTVAVTHAALTELAAAIDTEVQVDIVSSALPSGAATSAKQDTQTTALQAIQTAVEILDNTVGGNELQVDIVSSALPSGASTLAEQQTQTTALQLIDDAVFVDDADWTDNTSKHINIGGVYQSSPHTVTDGDVSPALMDANGRLIVAATDNGGSLTVDGTVAATQSGTWNVTNVSGTVSLPTGAATSAKQDTVIGHLDGVEGLLTTIDADTGTIAGAVSGSEMQVDVVAALPAGTNNIGDVDVLTLPALPAGNNNIGDVDIVSLPASTNTIEVVGDIAHDTGVSGNPVQIAGAAQNMDDTAPPNRVSAEADTTRLATDWDGAIFAHPHGPQIWTYHLDTSTAQTDTEVHAATGSASLCLYVTDIVFSHDGTAAINLFFEETTNKRIGPLYLPATAGGVKLHFGTPRKLTANTALTLTTSASHAHSVEVTGFTGQG